MMEKEVAAVDAASLIYPDSYLLRSLELYNWGPFSKRHHVSIDPQGTAIIGATGSGKTTLVDALMTLICERPKYNLASTGGHESDRDLVSYVRGKVGEGNSVDESHIARPGKTVSAIAACFSNGEQPLQIVGLFWFESSGSALSDLKRLWIFNQSEVQDFDALLELHHEGGSKALKRLAKSTAGLSTPSSKKGYLAQLRRFFEVGENAFTLLNRAAGLKQLNSIDEIFRELVLDDHAAFERAVEVVNGFSTLTTIHDELLIARNQQATLLPIQEESLKHAELQEKWSDQNRLLQWIPTWYAEQRFHLLQVQSGQLQQQIECLRIEIEELERQDRLLQQQVESLQAAYMAVGGGDLDELKHTLKRLEVDQQRIAGSANEYRQLMRYFELDDRLEAPHFAANQQQLKQHQAQLQQSLSEQQVPWRSAIAQVQNLTEALQENRDELQRVTERPSSNIPSKFDTFRQQMAQQLGVTMEDLPYLSELVEVKAEESEWRGAIERAIGSHRLRILVPAGQMKAALSWVNHRDNRLHVRLLEVSESSNRAHFMEDGFVRKLNFKKHPYREGVKQLLAGIDRHCVVSPEALRNTPHGMTREGTMSGKQGYFEKQDQRSINENWMTGFDNRDRLAQMRLVIEQYQQKLEVAKKEERATERAVKRIEQELQQITEFQRLTFQEIDVDSCEQEMEQYQQRIASLQDPDSDTGKAHQQLKDAQDRQRGLNDTLTGKRVDQEIANKDLAKVEQQKSSAFGQIGKGLDDEQREWLEQRIEVADIDSVDGLQADEKEQTATINRTLSRLNEVISGSERRLVRQMGKAKSVDTGALAETGTELQDIPDYLNRLERLTREALPEKESRFLEYLRNSSDQSVTQLLSGVENEVSIIEERIDDLNQAMYPVDFQTGRYLRLNPQRVEHESIRTLNKAQRYLNSARMKEDQGESHYKALQQVVDLLRDAAENRKRVGARALLDPRYRLQFSASTIDRAEQRVIDRRDGSQGGSGGEKEIITSYILTASLSYALCPQGAKRPLFGTIVLDEAFSKSSHAVAGSIISALRQFGLHPLFVTPNKEMQLLRSHTRSAVLVHRKGSQATTTSMSWEELKGKALQVKRDSSELKS